MSTLTFGFIGLGLIGGSIARAIRQNLPQSQIIAYDINADTLREAAQCGVANVITTRIDASFSDCDYLFLCAPVQKNDENLSAVKEILSPKTLLTDVGSVKSEIHTEIKKAGLEGQFIGGHPMAGSDRIGFINSKAVLLENAYYILTPTDSVPENKVTDYKNLVRMCLIHDLGECFTGDIPAFDKTADDSAREEELLGAWVAQLPQPVRGEMAELYAEMEALGTPEARVYKCLDKLEAVIQHNESDIATWLPREYELNLTYADENVAFSDYLKRLREEVRRETRDKIAAAEHNRQ